MLEQGTAGVWQPLVLAPGASGLFTATASPTQTTDFRLTLGTSRVVVRVPVSPAVALQQGDATLTGSVQPALAGAPVDVQFQDGASWTSIAAATVAADGSFSAPATLDPGAYRAVVPAGA